MPSLQSAILRFIVEFKNDGVPCSTGQRCHCCNTLMHMLTMMSGVDPEKCEKKGNGVEICRNVVENKNIRTIEFINSAINVTASGVQFSIPLVTLPWDKDTIIGALLVLAQHYAMCKRHSCALCRFAFVLYSEFNMLTITYWPLLTELPTDAHVSV